jgi:hypothetical protein
MGYEDEERPDDKPARRREDVGLPPWAKLALTVIGTTVTTIVAMFLWATSMFVSRVEYAGHTVQNSIDMARLAETQVRYAIAEKGTSDNLNELREDVSAMKADLSWVRRYLDLSQSPPPPKNKTGTGTHR